MELRIENGWNGNGWLFDRLNGAWKQFEGIQPREAAPQRHLVPAADVVEDKDGYHLYFEMPGFKNEDIDVKVEDDNLVIAAERKRPELAEGAKAHVAERHYGSVRRAFELPDDAHRENIRASYKDGVLEVTVEKRPEAKPVKIQIN